jgi:hypothetical protein
MIKHLLLLAAVIGCIQTAHAADTLFVDAIAEPGNNGQSWNAPYRTLAEALEKAAFGDEIWMKRGTHRVSSTLSMKDGVQIFGGFRGREVLREHRDWFRFPTIIEPTNDAPTLFTMDNLDSLTRLDGLILQGATQSAVVVTGGVPAFFNCVFQNNNGLNGAAIRATGVGRMRIEFCVFRDNRTEGEGGALYIADAPTATSYGWGPFIGENLFYSNQASMGGAVFIDNVADRPQIASCVFVNNSAGTGGGYASARCFSYVTNCTFYKNTTSIAPHAGRSVAFNGGYIQNSIFWNGDESDTSKHIVEVETQGDTARIETRACLVERDFDLGFWQSNPNFEDDTDVYGPDGFFGTDDDGLRLSNLSPVRDAGVIDGFVNHQPWDALGNARLVGRKIDLGAYESQRAGRLSPPELMQELKQGKLVIFFRHAKTDWGSKDPGPSPECFPGRNLIHEGREQSRDIGKMMRAQGLLIGDALSSPVCRCWETLELMVGYYEKQQHWASGGGAQVDSLRKADIQTVPFNGTRLISSHDAVGQVIFNPSGTGEILL